MRAYTVTHAGLPQNDGDTTPFCEYAGKQADAAQIKNKVWDDYRDTGIKRSDIKIDEVEIPTDKKGLVAWLNKNAV